MTQLTSIATSRQAVSEKHAQMRALLTDANFEPMDPVDLEINTDLTEFARNQSAVNSGDTSQIDSVVRQIKAN